MAQFYILNDTSCPVRVTVTRIADRPKVRRLILTSEPIQVREKVVIEATISKNVHPDILVPGDPATFLVEEDNRVGARLKRGRSSSGDQLLIIIGFFC